MKERDGEGERERENRRVVVGGEGGGGDFSCNYYLRLRSWDAG